MGGRGRETKRGGKRTEQGGVGEGNEARQNREWERENRREMQ